MFSSGKRRHKACGYEIRCSGFVAAGFMPALPWSAKTLKSGADRGCWSAPLIIAWTKR